MIYKNLIEERKSVRDYKKDTLPKNILDKIYTFYENTERLVPGIGLSLMIKNQAEIYHQLNGTAGYEGIMIKAPHYILLLSEKKDHYIENSGYLGEKISLKALESGVNTCWITFPDSNKVKKRLFLDTDKEITAIIALGYDSAETRTVDKTKVGGNYSKSKLKIVKNNISTRQDIKDIVFIDRWNKTASYEDLKSRGLLDALNYARLAPSSLNRQPWRFIIDGEKVVLTIKDDNQIKNYDKKIDIGISMLYFEAIVSQTLKKVDWTFEEPDKDYNIPGNYKIAGYCTV